jgi:hypothetical protein
MKSFFGKNKPPPLPKRPTDVENLTALFPGISPSMAEYYLRNNNGEFEKAFTELLEVQELLEAQEQSLQKRVSPKRVSPKRVSPKRVSPKRVSPKRVSPPKPKALSKVLTPLEELIGYFPDLEPQAVESILESNNGDIDTSIDQLLVLLKEEKIRNKAKKKKIQERKKLEASSGLIKLEIEPFSDGTKPIQHQTLFDIWIDGQIDIDAGEKSQILKQKFIDLFGGKNWNVLDPRGDGFCGLYTTSVDYNLANKDKPDFRPVSSRDEIIDNIMIGMDNYYRARHQHLELGIRLPRQIASEEIYIEFAPGIEEFDEELGFNVVTTEPDSITITLDWLLLDRDGIRERLNQLKDLPNISNEIFVLLAYAYKRNYLILRYDYQLHIKNEDPYYTTYIPCVLDVYKVDGRIIYPYSEDKAIMYNNGHYYLFMNEKSVISETIDRVISSDYHAWGNKNLGSGINVRRLRRSRKSRKSRKFRNKHKNKSKKAKFTKNIKQKYSLKKRKHNISKKY